jgi:hypothetical protein
MVYESNTREICSDQKSNELSLGRDYPFYFQFTLNPYNQDLESNLPAREERIDTFRRISENYGKELVTWRYDPIILSQKYDLSWHMDQF